MAGIVGTGRELLAAEEACRHGEFGRLFSDSPDPCRGHLPFSSRTAQRLMAIARHPVLSDPSHGSDLPASWRTLAELSRVEPESLERAMESGAVSAEMTRSQAVAIHRDPVPPHRSWELTASPEQLRHHEFERRLDRVKELAIEAMVMADRGGDWELLVRLASRVAELSAFLSREVSEREAVGRLVLEQVAKSGRWPEW